VTIICGGVPCDCSLEQLTNKQREVLEHLASHKSSKQIALDLGIHENTVNKHLTAVKEKWGTFDRNETARVFVRLAHGVRNHPPQFPSSDDYLIDHPEALADLPQSAEFRLSDVLASEPIRFPDSFAPVGLEALDARFGKAWRIAAVPIAAVLLGMVMIVMIAITQAMNELF